MLSASKSFFGGNMLYSRNAIIMMVMIMFGMTSVSERGMAAPSTSEALQEIQSGEVISFRTTWLEDDSFYYSGQYGYSTVIVNGEELLRQTGSFVYANGNKAEEESLLVPFGKKFRPRSFRLLVTNPSGKVMRTETMRFNTQATRAHVIRTYSDPTRQDDNGVTDEINKEIPIPADTYPRQMFDAMIRVMDFAPGEVRKLNVVTRMGEVFPIILRTDGFEQVKTPAGTFDTVRVRMIPDIPILPRLMPSLTIRIWYTASTPHLPVKFEGYPQPPPPRFQEEVRVQLTGLKLPTPK